MLPARVRGGELPRKHEAGTASGAVLSLRRRRLDTHATVPCRRHDDPSMFPLGLSGLRAPSRRARDACPGGSPGANLRVPFLDSPMDSHHETGTVTLSGVRGVLPSTWPAGAHAWASARVHTSSESRMSQGVGRCHVDVPPRRETSPVQYACTGRTRRAGDDASALRPARRRRRRLRLRQRTAARTDLALTGSRRAPASG